MKQPIVSSTAALAGAAVLLLCLVPIAHASAQTCVLPPTGLVSWWPGDGDAHDIAIGNDGSLQNGVAFAPGKVGRAFSFDGSHQFVEVPDAPSLNLTDGVTIGAWVFPTEIDGRNDVIINKETGPVHIQYELSIRGELVPGFAHVPVGTFMFFLGGIQGLPNDGFGWVSGGGRVPLNTWSHVALTFDGSTARAYIDGVLTRTVSNLSGNIGVTSGPLRLGSRSDGIVANAPRAPFGGLIDEVELFDRALSTDEIAAIFDADSAGRCKIAIDIKPGSDPSSIGPRSRGVIAVAILSSAGFYAPGQVLQPLLRFGRTGAEGSLRSCGAPEDVNADGLDDLVCHFYTELAGFQQGDTEGILTGMTMDLVPFRSRQAVRIVGR